MKHIRKISELFSSSRHPGDPRSQGVLGAKTMLSIPEDESLFTTEDGKKIFAGDTFYTAWINPAPSVTRDIANDNTTSLNIGNVKRFSTEEAADNYLSDVFSEDFTESLNHIKKFNEGTYQAHSTIPDANSKAIDRLKIGVKKYGFDSKFMKEYRALCQTLRYEELDSFFAKWGIQAPTNEGIFDSEDDKSIGKMMDDEIRKANLSGEPTITLTKEELDTFSKDLLHGNWSDTSYRICKFLGIDPTEGT